MPCRFMPTNKNELKRTLSAKDFCQRLSDVFKDADFGITEEEAYFELEIRIKKPPRDCLNDKLSPDFVKQNEKILIDYDEGVKRIREMIIELFKKLEYVSWV